MTEDPVDDRDGIEEAEEQNADETPETGVEAALEQPPEADSAGHLERRARLAEDRLTEVLAAYRQVRTENEGFRERVTRDVQRAFDRRHERLLLRFIEILDNLDRALEAAEQTYAGTPLIEGLILVRTQLLQTLQREGLERIPVLGLPFDPTFAEAVGTQPVADPEHDQVVVRELLRGYRVNGRLARASRVFVGQYDERATSGEGPATDLIGADEDAESPEAQVESAADPVTLDEEAMREILEGEEEEDD